MNPDFLRALEAARFYRRIGLVPVPSRMDDKGPALAGYTRMYSVPQNVCQDHEWRTANLQIFTGVKNSGAAKLLVVDLDGDEAKQEWKDLCAAKGFKPKAIWICKTGGGGHHLYFRLPPGVTSCPSRLIWGLWNPTGGPARKGGWAKHKEIRILGDTSLAIVPPSRHVVTGVEYQWIDGWNPKVFALPAEAPEWLLRLPTLENPMEIVRNRRWQDGQPATIKFPGAPNGDLSGTDAIGMEVKRKALLAAISQEEKLRLTKSWGLRLTGTRISEWAECRAVDREDRNPSANINLISGVYHDFGNGKKLSFFDLAVELGAYRDFNACFDSLKQRYLPSHS